MAGAVTTSGLFPRGEPALLALGNGAIFRGLSVGAAGEVVGEVVFNTAMTGYQEILSDPSYSRQLVTLTHPHIGNVGVNVEDDESAALGAGLGAAGLIVRSLCQTESNWRAQESLQSRLKRQGRVGIAEVDTRRLTRILRDEGAQSGCLLAGSAAAAVDAEERALLMARGFPGMAGLDLAREVTTPSPFAWSEPLWGQPAPEPVCDVAVLDFGVKRNILRSLVSSGCRVRVWPAQTPIDEVMASRPHGVVLSNGPGDPEPCGYAIYAARQLLRDKVPTLGICLGHQILGLAAGARTVKMKFGHHGANHPVKDLDTGRVLISSQNHGFAVDEASLPRQMRVTHRSLFDGSLQGIAATDAPALGFQGHPEAGPGPHDVHPLFDQFKALLQPART